RKLLAPASPDPAAFETLLRERQPRLVTFADWRALDKIEVERGAPQGRPRVKFTTIEGMLDAIPRD
ncbi:MAG TPA: NADP oxidoreductase, partial [Candidatus Eisenbacteria bacterium]|nr:NADP oxidoreductase [Candidatus Eisenbacteria bacterium]